LPSEGLAYVKQGILDATLEYPTGGKEAIESAVKLLSGEDVPKHITLVSRLYTKDNVDQGGTAVP
jgi:ribose transport system substrate-binding protein